ncbi:MAG TPA: hypothetical protein VLJ62_08755, partial [Burkholderiaceae bacterium]|nr:hypothetical protein [Burkholderiaceae bacterium]
MSHPAGGALPYRHHPAGAALQRHLPDKLAGKESSVSSRLSCSTTTTTSAPSLAQRKPQVPATPQMGRADVQSQSSSAAGQQGEGASVALDRVGADGIAQLVGAAVQARVSSARESLAHFIRAVPTRSDAECEAAAPALADAMLSVCDLRDAAGLLEEAFALAVSLPPAAVHRAFGYVSRAVRATHLQEAVLPAAIPATAGLPAVQKSAVIAALAGAVAAADLRVANRATALTRWIAARLQQSCAADAARLGAFVGAWIREGWGDAGWLDVLRNFLAHGEPACPHRAQALSAMVVAFAPKDDEPERLKILVRA